MVYDRFEGYVKKGHMEGSAANLLRPHLLNHLILQRFCGPPNVVGNADCVVGTADQESEKPLPIRRKMQIAPSQYRYK